MLTDVHIMLTDVHNLKCIFLVALFGVGFSNHSLLYGR